MMRIAHRHLIALAGMALAAAPATAADLSGNSDRELHRAGFAGIHLRMNIGDGRPAAPSARFAMGFVHHGNLAAAPGRQFHASWLEIGLSKTKRPELYVGQQRLTDVQKRLGIAPAAAVALGLGALATGAVVVASMDDDLHRYQCLLPEKELCKE